MPTKECPYAKSFMTPCYLKDGEVAIALTWSKKKICVGCARGIERLSTQRPKPLQAGPPK
jgi:hypothetical protein